MTSLLFFNGNGDFVGDKRILSVELEGYLAGWELNN
jgi:hypothetical protein